MMSGINAKSLLTQSYENTQEIKKDSAQNRLMANSELNLENTNRLSGQIKEDALASLQSADTVNISEEARAKLLHSVEGNSKANPDEGKEDLEYKSRLGEASGTPASELDKALKRAYKKLAEAQKELAEAQAELAKAETEDEKIIAEAKVDMASHKVNGAQKEIKILLGEKEAAS